MILRLDSGPPRDTVKPLLASVYAAPATPSQHISPTQPNAAHSPKRATDVQTSVLTTNPDKSATQTMFGDVWPSFAQRKRKTVAVLGRLTEFLAQ